jgi:septal ring factor EnvC (AmiA/AmiB activator)
VTGPADARRPGRARLAVLLALAMAAPGAAQSPLPAEHPVIARLRAAEAALSAASDPRLRLAALGEAAAAQEAALAALRAELRALAPRRVEAFAALEAERRAGFAAASALDRLARAPGGAFFAHPGGAVAAARAGMMLGDAAPALAQRAEAARLRLAGFARLEAERRVAAAAAAAALEALRGTRAEIAEVIAARAAREGLPPALERAAQRDAAALAEAAGALAALLSAPAETQPGAVPAGLPPPALGRLARGWGVSSAPGSRPGPAAGVALATAPWALVRAPATATLRYAGQVGGLGLVAVLEPAPGVLIVLQGLSRIDRAAGETLVAGEPLGAMGGPPPASEEFLVEATAPGGAEAEQTLYIEVRQGGIPVDPTAMFEFADERTGR